MSVSLGEGSVNCISMSVWDGGVAHFPQGVE